MPSRSRRTHLSTCLAHHEQVTPSIFAEWHEQCQVVKNADGDHVCTHPHRKARGKADVDAWVQFWATVGGLTDSPMTFTTEKSFISAYKKVDALADGLPCTWTPLFGPLALKAIFNSNTTLLCHLAGAEKSDDVRVAFFHQYGVRLLHAAILEGPLAPVLGSYAHVFLSLFGPQATGSLLRRYTKSLPGLLTRFVECVITRLEADSGELRDRLMVMPKSGECCCEGDLEKRSTHLTSILQNVVFVIQKLGTLRVSTVQRFVDVVLQLAAKPRMTRCELSEALIRKSPRIASKSFDEILSTALFSMDPDHLGFKGVENVGDMCPRQCACRPCLACKRSGSMMTCSRCLYATFCNADCFKLAWSWHKLVCSPVELNEEPDFKPRCYSLNNRNKVVVKLKDS